MYYMYFEFKMFFFHCKNWDNSQVLQRKLQISEKTTYFIHHINSVNGFVCQYLTPHLFYLL